MGIDYIDITALIYINYFIVEVSVRLELTPLGYKARILNLYTKRPSLTVAKLSILIETSKLFSNFFLTILYSLRDLNPYTLRYSILSAACLPFPTRE